MLESELSDYERDATLIELHETKEVIEATMRV